MLDLHIMQFAIIICIILLRVEKLIEPNIQAILDRIAKAVEAREITQVELSIATGVHQSQVSRILSGNLRRASKNVHCLCNYYVLHNSESEPTSTSSPPPDIRETLQHLITGGKVSDAALLRILESLAMWQQALVAHE